MAPGMGPTPELTATTRERPPRRAAGEHREPPAVDVVVPVYNEQQELASNVRRLHAYLRESFPFSFRVTIADNASTDRTWEVAEELAEELPGVRAVRLPQKGRGGALRAVWSKSDAAVLAYMDVDLSTDLSALLPLVAPLLSRHSDLAIGTRLQRSARVVRGPKREIISRCYNTLLKAVLGARFSDAQCGFKAIRSDVAAALLPLVEDTGWFFDTELLVLAERAGLRIHEVPVDWVDDPDSRVDVVGTALADLRGVVRLATGFARGRIPLSALRGARGATDPTGRPGFVGQAFGFAVVGVLSTLAYLALYLVLRTALPAVAANAVALLTTTIANTAANRRFSFGIHSRAKAVRHQVQGLVVFGLALLLTSGSLTVVRILDRQPSRLVEIGALVTANLAATCLRFVLLRHWVFSDRAASPSERSRRRTDEEVSVKGETGRDSNTEKAVEADEQRDTSTVRILDLKPSASQTPVTPGSWHAREISAVARDSGTTYDVPTTQRSER